MASIDFDTDSEFLGQGDKKEILKRHHLVFFAVGDHVIRRGI